MTSGLWLSYAFLTASVYATLSLLDKVVLDRKISTPFVTSALNSLPTLAIFLVIGILTGNTAIGSFTGSFDSAVPLLIGIGAGVVNVYGRIVYYRGMEVTDVSRFIPVINTDIVFVLVLAGIFFGETFSLPVYLGVAVIFVGTVLISLEDVTETLQITSRQALTFGLLSAFMLALINLLMEYLIPIINLYAVLFWFGVGGMLYIVVVAAWKSVRGSIGGSEKVPVLSAGSISLMISGVFNAAAYFTLVWALESGPVSIVTAIANLQVLLVFFGVLVLTKLTPEVLRESMSRVILVQKFTASVLMLVGVVLIQIFQ